jgi:hypothetical protein
MLTAESLQKETRYPLDSTLGGKGIAKSLGAWVEDLQWQPVTEIMKLKQIEIIY